MAQKVWGSHENIKILECRRADEFLVCRPVCALEIAGADRRSPGVGVSSQVFGRVSRVGMEGVAPCPCWSKGVSMNNIIPIVIAAGWVRIIFRVGIVEPFSQ